MTNTVGSRQRQRHTQVPTDLPNKQLAGRSTTNKPRQATVFTDPVVLGGAATRDCRQSSVPIPPVEILSKRGCEIWIWVDQPFFPALWLSEGGLRWREGRPRPRRECVPTSKIRIRTTRRNPPCRARTHNQTLVQTPHGGPKKPRAVPAKIRRTGTKH